MPSSRRVRLAFAPLLAALALLGLAFSASAALAAQTHVFLETFGSAGSGAGQLAGPRGLAVNQSTDDVYVAGTGNNRIDKFGLLVNFLRPTAALSIGAPA